MSTQIKICGLSTEASIDAAAEAGASHIGLVHYAPSPRHVELDRAGLLASHARSLGLKVVLLSVNAQPVPTGRGIEMVGPDILQFHGDETPEWCALVREKTGIELWKARGVSSAQSLENALAWEGSVDRLLYDAPAKAMPGGTGTSFDWQWLADFEHRVDWGLAGGLTPDNVGEAIRQTGAPLVDTSSGVESAPGVKDVAKIAAFCQAVRDYDQAREPS